MKKINLIINEEINKLLLNESLTDVVYHFTTLQTLYDIIDSDAFYLPSSYGGFSDDYDKRKKFYISFTRQKNSKLGYSRGLPVRITLNGELLNQRFKGKPINYWGEKMGKNSYFSNPSLYGGDNVDYYQSNTENEDRLLSNDPVIYNFHNYIKRIDVLIDESKENHVNFAKKFVYGKYRNFIHVYNDENEFNKQSKNEINDNLSYDTSGVNLKSKRINGCANDILDIVFFILCVDDVNINDMQKYSAMLLKKYGLEKFISSVVKNINSKSYYTISDLSIIDNVKRLHKEDGDMDTYVKVARMVRDFFQRKGFNNEREAKDYLIKYTNKKYSRVKYDYNKEIKFLVLYLNGFKYILPHPESTPFFDVFPYSKDILIDEIPYNVKSYQSRDIESFKKYLMHLVKSKISITNMLQVIKKLDVDEYEKENLLNSGRFQYNNITYDDILYNRYRFINREEEDDVMSMFELD